MFTGLFCAVATTALFPASGHAQSTEQSGTVAAATAEPTAPSPEGDIVVTANRTASLASKTPISLTAIGGDALRSAAVTSTLDVATLVPNVSIDRSAANGIQITIRGITSNDNSEKGDPSAAFLLDGVYIARTQVQDTSFYDIDRVEVLRGPQGTLYGRNTTAGVVNVITNKPRFEFEGAANAAIGNFGTYQADVMLNLPVNDSVAVRVAGSYDRRDNYIINAGGSPFSVDPYKNNLSVRLQTLVKIGANATLNVTGDYSRIGGNAVYQTLATQLYDLQNPRQPLYRANTGDAGRTLTLNFGRPTDNHNDTWGIGGELNWDMGPLTMTYLGSYREFTRDENFVLYIGIPSSGPFQGTYRQISQELRFATNGDGPLKLQFGGYFFREKSDIQLSLLGLDAVVGAPVFAFPQHTTSKSYAGFGQATYSVTGNLRLTGGIRYSRDEKSRNGGTTYQRTLVFNPSTDRLLLNYASRDWSKLTWRAGVDFDVDDRTLLYGSVSTGYKAGGFNDGCEAGSSYDGTVCNQVQPDNLLYYAPETLTAYELGVKTRLLDNALRLNASAFHYDYKNLQLSQFVLSSTGPVTVTQNAAAAKVTGAEVEAVIAPDPRNRVDLTFTWLDAHYANYLPLGTADLSYSGRKLDRSPSTTVSVGYSYTLPISSGATLVGSVRSRLSDSYVVTNFGVPAQYRQPSYTRTDLSIQYNAAAKAWYVGAYARNLENTLAITAIDGFNSISVSDPRTYGVRAGVRF